MSQNVLIIRAGIGGLAAAAVLLARGHRVRVDEQAPALGESPRASSISANASRALHALGREDALTRVAVIPTAQHFRVYSTGELLTAIPLGQSHERTHAASITTSIALTCMPARCEVREPVRKPSRCPPRRTSSHRDARLGHGAIRERQHRKPRPHRRGRHQVHDPRPNPRRDESRVHRLRVVASDGAERGCSRPITWSACRTKGMGLTRT